MAKGKNTPEVSGSFDDKKYQAERDARTLIEAEHIKSDAARLKAAKTAAKQMAEDALKAVNAAKTVSG